MSEYSVRTLKREAGQLTLNETDPGRRRRYRPQPHTVTKTPPDSLMRWKKITRKLHGRVSAFFGVADSDF